MAIYLNNTTIKRGNSGIPIIYKAENLGKEINFLDYDGTILYSYTAVEFAALSSIAFHLYLCGRYSITIDVLS